MTSEKIIRVSHLAYSDNQGGASRAAYRIHKALSVYENKRIISSMRVLKKFTNDSNVKGGIVRNGLLKFLFQKNINKIARYLYSINYPNEKVYSLAWPSTGIGCELNRAFRNKKIDILNIHYLADNTISIREIGKLQMPLVWRLNDQWPFCSCEHYATKFDQSSNINLNEEYISGYTNNYKLNKKLFDLKKLIWMHKKNSWNKKIIHIVAPSNWIAQCAKKSYLFKNQPIKIIPSAINLEFWNPINKKEARNELKISFNKKVILFGALGGTRDFRKGGDLLINALSFIKTKVSNDFLENIQLLIFGQDKPDEELIHGYKVEYFGEIKNDQKLKLLYSSSDVFILPSRQDNLPGTGIEAQACGTPVIAFDTCGLRDIIEDNKTGCLVKAFDYKLLAKKILWILKNEDIKLSMSESSIKRALNLWDEKLISKKYTDLYREIIFS